MNTSSDAVPLLLAALYEARSDARVARVLAPDQRCGLTLWVLEEKRMGGTSRLVYGWAISSASPQSTKKWGASEVHLDGAIRMARLTTTDTGATILSLIEQLLRGQSLGAASIAYGIELPRYGAGLCLVGDEAGVARSYQVSPVVLLETADALIGRATYAMPLRSPNSAAPGYSVSLYLAEKARMWSRESSEVPAGPVFTRDLGLVWLHADAARLRDAELQEVQRVINQTWDALDRQRVEERHADITGLLGFAERVRAAMRDRIAATTA